jgi:hypothetical protein
VNALVGDHSTQALVLRFRCQKSAHSCGYDDDDEDYVTEPKVCEDFQTNIIDKATVAKTNPTRESNKPLRPITTLMALLSSLMLCKAPNVGGAIVVGSSVAHTGRSWIW